jgi:hypothetical protein
MANKSLNEKYNIPFLSEWKDKDGNTYTAFKIEYSFKKICSIPIVAYTQTLTDEQKIEMIKNQRINMFIKTVVDFKDCFKQIL